MRRFGHKERMRDVGIQKRGDRMQITRLIVRSRDENLRDLRLDRELCCTANQVLKNEKKKLLTVYEK